MRMAMEPDFTLNLYNETYFLSQKNTRSSVSREDSWRTATWDFMKAADEWEAILSHIYSLSETASCHAQYYFPCVRYLLQGFPTLP